MHICDNIYGTKEAGHKLESLPNMGDSSHLKGFLVLFAKDSSGTRAGTLQGLEEWVLSVFKIIICMSKCIGFVWQNFSHGKATVESSLRSCQELPLCLTEPMSDGSKVDLPLANAEPISDYCCTSGVIHLRKEKTACTPPAQERSEDM